MSEESTSRASEFISLFSRLEHHLKSTYGIEARVGFADLVEQVAQKNSTVRARAWWLKDFGQLRNAIVHRWDDHEEVIAEPSERALIEFRACVEAVLSPTQLVDIASLDVRTYDSDCQLVDVLSDMYEQEFSQVIVRSKLKLSLLSTDGTTR
jgi:hypothetical protein